MTHDSAPDEAARRLSEEMPGLADLAALPSADEVPPPTSLRMPRALDVPELPMPDAETRPCLPRAQAIDWPGTEPPRGEVPVPMRRQPDEPRRVHPARRRALLAASILVGVIVAATPFILVKRLSEQLQTAAAEGSRLFEGRSVSSGRPATTDPADGVPLIRALPGPVKHADTSP